MKMEGRSLKRRGGAYPQPRGASWEVWAAASGQAWVFVEPSVHSLTSQAYQTLHWAKEWAAAQIPRNKEHSLLQNIIDSDAN